MYDTLIDLVQVLVIFLFMLVTPPAIFLYYFIDLIICKIFDISEERTIKETMGKEYVRKYRWLKNVRKFLCNEDEDYENIEELEQMLDEFIKKCEFDKNENP